MGNDFVLTPNGSHDDLKSYFVEGSFLGHRPSFNVDYFLSYKNQGTTTQNAQLIFSPDTGLIFISSSVTTTNHS